MAAFNSKAKSRANKSSSSEEEEEIVSSTLNEIPPQQDGLPQTGPKGVLSDYRRFKEQEQRAKIIEEQKRQQLIKKMAPTVKPHSEEVDSQDMVDTLEQLDIDKDPFIQHYKAQRILQMKEQAKAGRQRRMFGHLTELRGDKYASAIDSAPPDTFVIMHIYDEFYISCVKLNRCLTDLAKKYPTVKFCRIQSHQLELSKGFLDKGIPALLVYKGGEIVGNLLKVSDNLGDKFTTEDVEDFLQDKECLPSTDESRIFGAYNLSPRPSLTKQTLSDTDDDEI